MTACADCGAADAPNSIGRRQRCNQCALVALSAVTVERDSQPGLAHEIPRARRPQRIPDGRTAIRHQGRARAERAAQGRLKLMYLPEFQAILAEELRLAGQLPPVTRPLDIYLRQLASRRLLTFVQRMDVDA